MKKLLVWDGDETLWHGTLVEGDDISMTPERLALCEQLHDRGVLQAIASFNRPADVEQAIYKFGLDRWFLHSAAGFETSKSALLAKIKSDYDLSRWSDVVFIDDNAGNRGEVQFAFPDVTVGGPEDVEAIVAEHFTKSYYTDEDRRRVRRYQSESLRRASAAAYGDDRMAFLKSCAIEVEIGPATLDDIERIQDLAQRANRMAAIAEVDGDADWLAFVRAGSLVVVRVRDRFGDYGLSAFVASMADGATTEVLALVVSCRLQGRGIGSAILGWLLNATGEPMSARWTETEYNAGMRQLYEWYGFAITTEGDRVSARRASREPVQLPDWITVRTR